MKLTVALSATLLGVCTPCAPVSDTPPAEAPAETVEAAEPEAVEAPPPAPAPPPEALVEQAAAARVETKMDALSSRLDAIYVEVEALGSGEDSAGR